MEQQKRNTRESLCKTHHAMIEIDRLLEEIERLRRAEQGEAASETHLPTGQPRKDFAIQEQPSSSGSRKDGYFPHRKYVAFLVGIMILLGVALGIFKLIDFMRSNDIRFIQRHDDSTFQTLIPLSELSIHNSPANDCWVVFHGQVYDVTDYAKRHPAGPAWITSLCGSDGTSEYAKFHSEALLRSIRGDMVGTFTTDEDLAMEESPFLLDDEDENVGATPTASPHEFKSVDQMEEIIPCQHGREGDIVCVSINELATHDTPEDCWVALHGMVFDLTHYATNHPGGASAVTALAGTDGTEEYARFHSATLLSKLGSDTYIGVLMEQNAQFLSLTAAADITLHAMRSDSSSSSSSSSSDDSAPITRNPILVTPVECCTTNPTASPIVLTTATPTFTSISAGLTEITMSELSLHNTANDCWLELHGEVYNLTEYDHPGPSLCQEDASGVITNQNITTAFDSADNPQHPISFLPQVAAFRVGVLLSTTSNATGRMPTPTLPVPTKVPTMYPTLYPTQTPVQVPNENPTQMQTAFPTTLPSTAPFTAIATNPPTSSPVSETSSRGISLDEVASHNTKEDCWVILYEDVYDLTTYFHPGTTDLCGAGRAGTNQTEAYIRAPNHDTFLLANIVSSLKIDPSTVPADVSSTATPTVSPTLQPSIDTTESPTFLPSLTQTSAPVSTPAPSTATTTPTTKPTIQPASSPVSGTSSGGISLDEVASHNTKEDCWVILYEDVYDLTTYFHPGTTNLCGAGRAGTNQTEAYIRAPNHDTFLLADMVSILRIDPSTVPTDVSSTSTPTHSPTLQPSIDTTESPTFLPSLAQTSAPVSTPAPSTATTTPTTKPTIQPTSSPVSGTSSGGISPDEVASHNTKEDCWVILYEDVYDLTTYFHPGTTDLCGAGRAGTNQTEAYIRAPNHDTFLLANIASSLRIDPATVPTDVSSTSTPTHSPTLQPSIDTTESPTFLPSLAQTSAPVSTPAPSTATTTPTTETTIQPTSSPVSGTSSGGISLDEVASHNTKEDCWVILYDDVYDLTTYFHPGTTDLCGAGRAGTNQTEAYIRAPNHDTFLLADMVSSLRIDPSTVPADVSSTATPTVSPTLPPSVGLTDAPIQSPSLSSTELPVVAPMSSLIPSVAHTAMPTWSPTLSPSSGGSLQGSEGTGTIRLSDAPNNRCWVAIHRNVYDLTEYVHPGGRMKNCGGDATRDFQAVLVPTHTPELLKTLPSMFYLGPLEGHTPELPDTPATTAPTGTPRCVSRSELADHDRRNDCWVALHGFVYDLTKYDHPGGRLDCGEDVTDDFDDEDDPPHSLSWISFIAEYKVGHYGPCAELGTENIESVVTREVNRVELESHSRRNDCWVAIYGTVYELTEYQHPGGQMQHCGSDVTRHYQSVQSPVHTVEMLTSVAGFRVGTYTDAPAGNGSIEAAIPNPVQTVLTTGGGTITEAELSSHRDKGRDCWAVYHGNVYDLTAYNHPGGNGRITCGVDDTLKYSRQHNTALLGSIANLLIGSLEGGSPACNRGCGAMDSADESDESEDSD